MQRGNKHEATHTLREAYIQQGRSTSGRRLRAREHTEDRGSACSSDAWSIGLLEPGPSYISNKYTLDIAAQLTAMLCSGLQYSTVQFSTVEHSQEVLAS